jgi:RimJ/RimL family protein N-acetyltransferase
VATVPDLRGDPILLNAHADEDAAAHVDGEDEETARRFGWWPARSTEETVRAAYANWARNWRDDGPTRAFAARDPETGALVGGCELRRRVRRIHLSGSTGTSRPPRASRLTLDADIRPP